MSERGRAKESKDDCNKKAIDKFGKVSAKSRSGERNPVYDLNKSMAEANMGKSLLPEKVEQAKSKGNVGGKRR